MIGNSPLYIMHNLILMSTHIHNSILAFYTHTHTHTHRERERERERAIFLLRLTNVVFNNIYYPSNIVCQAL